MWAGKSLANASKLLIELRLKGSFLVSVHTILSHPP